MNKCRFCSEPLEHTFVDLGASPLANSYLKPSQLQEMEPFFPLCVYVCQNCFLVQLPEWETPENIFGEYAYFSSFSDSWLQHAKRYTELVVERFKFDTRSYVVEIASNDGYLLQYFKEKDIPVMGIEPANNVAKVAREKGIPTISKFFGVKTAQEFVEEGKQADLLLGNNVLAHVPNLNDFVEGMKIVLSPRGLITMEFPHLLKLMDENQFDTIYHEHFSYFSFITVQKVFAKHGLTLFDVEELSTHGGSLRIYGRHSGDSSKPITDNVAHLLEKENKAGLQTLSFYMTFAKKVLEIKLKIYDFLVQARKEGKTVVGYGAPAKGNTLLNYCGIKTDFIDYTVDRSPHKQGHYLPGSHIPIYAPDKVIATKPDYLLILPWNLREEIMDQMSHVKQWGCKFVTFVPEVQVV